MTAAGHWQQNDRRVPSGTVFTDRGDFVSKMQAAGCTIAREAAPADPGEKYTPVLMSLTQPQDPWRVLIEAKEDIHLKPGLAIRQRRSACHSLVKRVEAEPIL